MLSLPFVCLKNTTRPGFHPLLMVGILIFTVAFLNSAERLKSSVNDDVNAKPAGEVSSAVFRVYPVMTDLQRHLLPPRRNFPTRVYVRINGNRLAKVDQVESLAKTLEPIARKEKCGVYFGVSYVGIPDRFEQATLDKKLEEWSKEIGFQSSQVVSQHRPWPNPTDWEDYFNAIRISQGEDADGQETVVGNELVNVYPIRTVLSRVLTENADCRVEILPIIDGTKNPLTAEMRNAIEQSVAKVGQVKKRKINFVLEYGPGEAAQTAVENLHQELSAFSRNTLGFAEVTTTRTRVALGKKAKQKAGVVR